MASLGYPSLLILLTLFSCAFSYTFTITNNCQHTIWPGTLAGSASPRLSTTGFRLESGQSVKLTTVPGWSGRIWARTGCKFDSAGIGKCQTGDCGGRLECDGNGAAAPTSLFEITLGVGNGQDFYDVSMVDGYNLPMLVLPRGVYGGACNATGCMTDINRGCPRELQLLGGNDGNQVGVIGCRSACQAFKLDKYCCSGQFANPNTCQPSIYSTIFKRACPRAYSYAFDDGTSTFTCKASEYAIVFCPNSNGNIVPNHAPPPPPRQPRRKGHMVPSSSNTVLPFPVPILLLVASLTFSFFCSKGTAGHINARRESYMCSSKEGRKHT